MRGPVGLLRGTVSEREKGGMTKTANLGNLLPGHGVVGFGGCSTPGGAGGFRR